MKDIPFVESGQSVNGKYVEVNSKRIERKTSFKCGHCGRKSDYLEEQGLPLNARGQVFAGRDYELPLLCPNCFTPVERIRFRLKEHAEK